MVTAQELENAKIDTRTIGESVNENKIVTPRYGAPFKSMPMIAEEMQSVIGTIIAGGVPASIVADESGLSQQQINDNNESALADRYTKSELDIILDDKANLSVVSLKADTFTKSEVNALVAPKADTAYVDTAVGAISTDASKQYATLVLANADIANIPLNKNVFVSEATNGGYWYKATGGATSLTKSPYDPVTQAKNYTDTIKLILDKDISTNKDSSTKLLVAMQELVKALDAESLDLNQKISNVLSSITIIQSGIVGVNDELTQHLTAIHILVKNIESSIDLIQKNKDVIKDQIVSNHLLVQQLLEVESGVSSGIGNARGVFKYGDTYAKNDVFTHASGTYVVLESVANAQITPDQDENYKRISESEYAQKVAEMSVKSVNITTNHPSSEVPHTISPDGLTMWVTYAMGKLRESKDFGVTWQDIYDFGDLSRVVWVRQTDNNELLLRTETYVYGSGGVLTDVRQRVHRSVGYGTANMTFETCIDIQNRRNVIFHNGWSISIHKNIILLSEYGSKGDDPWGVDGTTLPVELSARYAYMSLDCGVTWTTIFDTHDHITDPNGVHIHSICYDPYWERIWVNCGDRVSGLWYSDDLGQTWIESEYFERIGEVAPEGKRQNVGIIALPTCILFGTDYAQDGVQRIVRAHGNHIAGGKYPDDVAYAIDFGQGHTRAQVCHIINHTYQKTNAPIIFGFCSETPVAGTAPAGTVIITYDGWNFKQIWQDELWQPTGKGLQSLAGITLLNEIIIKSVDSRSAAGKYTKITLKV